jgi:hypothetical protein
MADNSTAHADSVTNAFAAALAQALRQVDGHGRVTADDAACLRRVIAETPRQARLAVTLALEASVGPFASLPRQAQEALVRTIVEADWWRMAGRNLGPWPYILTRLVYTTRDTLRNRPFGRQVRHLCNMLRGFFQSGPAYALDAVHRRPLLWQARVLARPALRAMLQLADIEPWYFAVGYAQGIPQLAPFRGFWHDPARKNTIGVMLGIDLLPTPQGWWFIESNLNSALRLERTALYDRDPFVANLLAFIKAHGYRHLVILGNNVDYVDALMARQYAEGAAAARLKLTILEDAYLPKKVYGQSFHVPLLEEEGTLLMRLKFYRTSLDYLFQHKRASRHALELYQQHMADPLIRLVPTGFSPFLDEMAPEAPFPNLVYKFPEQDSGKGVLLLKATSLEHAHAVLHEAIRQHHLTSLFDKVKHRLVRPDDVGLCQPYLRASMLPGRRLYIVRAHVLLTPIGVHFLSAHRVVAGQAVPEHLPPGLVHDPKPYLVNYSAGAKYEVVPPDEEPEVVQTALALARGFAWAATYGFQTIAP